MNVAVPIGSILSPYDIFKTDNIDWKKIYIIGFEIHDEINDRLRTVMVDPHEFFDVLYTRHLWKDINTKYGKELYTYMRKYKLNTKIGRFAFPLSMTVYDNHNLNIKIPFIPSSFDNILFYPNKEDIEKKIKSIWISY